jgi:hypothetical protein
MFRLRVVLCIYYVWIERVTVGHSSLGLPYNEGHRTVITSDDLIATGAQGEPAACAGDQGGRCCGTIGRSVRSHARQM